MVKKEKVTSLRVDEGLWKEVKLHAVKEDTTMSKLVERLLREGITRDKRSKSLPAEGNESEKGTKAE